MLTERVAMTIDDQVQRYHGPLRHLLDSRIHKRTLDVKKGSEIKNPQEFFVLSFEFCRHANYKEIQNSQNSCEFCAHVTCPFISDVTDSIE